MDITHRRIIYDFHIKQLIYYFLIFATKNPSVSLSCGHILKHFLASSEYFLFSNSVIAGLLLISSFIYSNLAFSYFFNKKSTTSSFSSDSSEHVEYTKVPFSFNKLNPVSISCFWVIDNLITMSGFQILSVFRLFLIVPVPEQGASTSILSNSIPDFLNHWPSIKVIIAFETPHLCKFIDKGFI